ncbi:hypothetical protein [Streptomyces sp. OP7]|uniref:hypothetical protein n=1 Tax=Streptomyces sp. OP7 TaxID=3142462 RepID=UPI0032E8C797
MAADPLPDLESKVLHVIRTNQHRTVRSGWRYLVEGRFRITSGGLQTTKILGARLLHGIEQGEILAALRRLQGRGAVRIDGHDLNTQRVFLERS